MESNMADGRNYNQHLISSLGSKLGNLERKDGIFKALR